MNALVLYFSKYGNTQQVAESVGEGLQGAGRVNVRDLESLSASDLQGVDLVVMGTPTHKMNLPQAVRPVLDALPRRALKGMHVAAFDTSYKMSWWLNHFTAARRLMGRLRRLGGSQVASPETFLVMEREGPLYDGELDRAQRWGRELRGAAWSENGTQMPQMPAD